MNSLRLGSKHLSQLYFLFVTASLVLFFASCEGDAFTKVVDVDLETPEPLPVVFANWNNRDSFLYVYLSESTGALQENLPSTLTGARVEGFVDGVSFGVFTEVSIEIFFQNTNLTIDPTDIIYRFPRPASIQPGVEVSINIELANGATLSAKDRLPLINPITLDEFIPPGIDTVFFGSSGDFFFTSTPGSLKLRLTDVASQEDSYRFQVGTYIVDSTSGDLTLLENQYLNGNEQDSRWEFISGGDVYRDFGLDGSSFTISGELFFSPSVENKLYFANSEVLSPLAYRFFKELQALEDAEFNPFAEPVVLGSNVEGGLGHFVCSSFSPEIRWN